MRYRLECKCKTCVGAIALGQSLRIGTLATAHLAYSTLDKINAAVLHTCTGPWSLGAYTQAAGPARSHRVSCQPALAASLPATPPLRRSHRDTGFLSQPALAATPPARAPSRSCASGSSARSLGLSSSARPAAAAASLALSSSRAGCSAAASSENEGTGCWAPWSRNAACDRRARSISCGAKEDICCKLAPPDPAHCQQMQPHTAQSAVHHTASWQHRHAGSFCRNGG